LNASTIKDAYPLPSIEGILSRIDQTHYISSVDLKLAFWQIELDERSKEYTAFTAIRAVQRGTTLGAAHGSGDTSGAQI